MMRMGILKERLGERVEIKLRDSPERRVLRHAPSRFVNRPRLCELPRLQARLQAVALKSEIRRDGIDL
jgi:hypothetical protein